jgi:mono/diheme cytochrome c family protein
MIAKKGKKGIMPAYPAEKLSDADLDSLVAYLATLK